MFPFLGMTQNDQFDFDFVESTVFKDEKRAGRVLAMYVTDNNITTVRMSYNLNRLLWDVFDKNMNQQHREEIEIEEGWELYEGHLTNGNELIVFTRRSEGASSKETFYSYTFNIADKTHEKKIFLESDIKNPIKRFVADKANRRMLFAISPNKKYLAIAANDDSYFKNSYKVHVYDAKTLALAYTNSYSQDTATNYKPGHFMVNDEGTVYCLGENHSGKSRQIINNKTTYDGVLYKITKDTISHTIIPQKNKKIRALKIHEKDDKLVLLGLLAGGFKYSLKSLYQYTISKKELKILNEKEIAIPENIYFELFREKVATQQRNTQAALKNYVMSDFIVDANENIYMIVNEIDYAVIWDTSELFAYNTELDLKLSSQDQLYVDNLTFGSLLVFKFNSSGRLLWGKAINRSETGSMHNAFLKDDKLQIFLNANQELRFKEDGRVKFKAFSWKQNALYHITFQDFNEPYYTKFDLQELDERRYIAAYGYYEDGVFIIPEHWRRNKRFIKFY
jgi:hypothetical protein